MKAVLLDGYGGLEVMRVGEIEKPSPSEGQVLIKVECSSVNRPDIVQRQGKYPPPKGESKILGLEVAGVIEEVGADVISWKKGTRVMSLVSGGGYSEYAVAYANHLIRIPDCMNFEEAACVCESYITAFLNIFMIGGLKDGQSILIHGGGGGVNTAAIQLCKALTPNAKVIITASPGKINRVKELGANFIVNYKEHDFAKQINAYTKMKGVNLIIDHIGAEYLSRNMESLAYEGKVIIIGVMGGVKAELNLAIMMAKRQCIIGSVLRSRSVQEKGEITAKFIKTVLHKFADRTIVPIIYKVFSLNDVVEAHRTMEKSKHFGKLVLKISP